MGTVSRIQVLDMRKAMLWQRGEAPWLPEARTGGITETRAQRRIRGERLSSQASRAMSAAAEAEGWGRQHADTVAEKFPKLMRRQTSKGQRTQNKQAGSPLRLSVLSLLKTPRRDLEGLQRRRYRPRRSSCQNPQGSQEKWFHVLELASQQRK